MAIQEDVEDISNSAVKELQIEEKLAVVQEDWADCQLIFQNFKSRGPICLQQGPTMELLEKLEEAKPSPGKAEDFAMRAPSLPPPRPGTKVRSWRQRICWRRRLRRARLPGAARPRESRSISLSYSRPSSRPRRLRSGSRTRTLG